METLRQLQHLPPYAGFLALQSSPWTRTAYAQALRSFKSFLDARGLTLDSMDRRDVLEFHSVLAEPGLTPSGRSRRAYSTTTLILTLTAVRKFYAYLGAVGMIKENPTLILGILKLKRPGRLPRALAPMDRLALLSSLRIDSRRNLQTSLAVLLGFQCGLRVSELARLEVSRVDLRHGELSVIGKGDKERRIPLTGQAVQLIRAWLRRRLRRSSPWLFPAITTFQPVHVKPQVINGWLRDAARWAGLPPFTVHVLRHTFGTQLAETGATPYEIRDLMGHGTILVGETYVKIASDAPRQAHARAFGEKIHGGARGRESHQVSA